MFDGFFVTTGSWWLLAFFLFLVIAPYFFLWRISVNTAICRDILKVLVRNDNDHKIGMMVHDLKELQETTNQILLEDVKDQLISIKESVEGVHYTVVDFRDTVKHT
tara:strand:- start:287 stop:604 length:318 start_codon:yes stop_codon:yes gene_type:complete